MNWQRLIRIAINNSTFCVSKRGRTPILKSQYALGCLVGWFNSRVKGCESDGVVLREKEHVMKWNGCTSFYLSMCAIYIPRVNGTVFRSRIEHVPQIAIKLQKKIPSTGNSRTETVKKWHRRKMSVCLFSPFYNSNSNALVSSMRAF